MLCSELVHIEVGDVSVCWMSLQTLKFKIRSDVLISYILQKLSATPSRTSESGGAQHNPPDYNLSLITAP